jgi:nucleoside 2-deoxyribosyltransferase
MDKKCFFVTPIGEEGSEERNNSDTLLQYFIEPVCHELGIEVIRVDKLTTVDNIDRTIIEHLRNDDLVIVDMTFSKPNVFYEFGYRSALNKPLIPMVKRGHSIPFDVTTLRTIEYVTDDLTKVDSIKERLTQTIETFNLDEIEDDHHDDHHDVQTNSTDISLLKIQDQLEEIRNSIIFSNKNVISHISEDSKSKESIEEKLFSEMLSDPKKFDSLLQMQNQIDKFNKKGK